MTAIERIGAIVAPGADEREHEQQPRGHGTDPSRIHSIASSSHDAGTNERYHPPEQGRSSVSFRVARLSLRAARRRSGGNDAAALFHRGRYDPAATHEV